MDTRRLVLFMVFVFSLFMLWENWQRYQNPLQPAGTAQGNSAAPSVSPVLPAPTTPALSGVPRPEVSLLPATPPAESPFPATTTASATAAETFSVRTDLFTARISTQGGDLVGLELNRFKAFSDREKHFDLLSAQHRYAAQTGLGKTSGRIELPNHKILLTPVPGSRELAAGQESFQVRLAAPEVDGVKATKVYTFRRGSYLIDVAWELENNGTETLKPGEYFAYFQLQRDGAAPEGDSFMLSTFYGAAVYTDAEKYQKVQYKDIAENKAQFVRTANDGWLALVQHYFVTAWVPQGNAPREFKLYALENNLYAAALILPFPGLAPGGKTEVRAPLFAGPQEQSALREVAPGLDLVVDYGWLHLIAAPIFWLLSFIHSLIGNWGWAIVALTVLIKLALFPLSAASYRSMARMRQITPRLMRLKELYASDKQRLNQEMMKLYQTEKINPLGGCLPILVQIPIFIALYWVLLGAVEMRDAPWIFWIRDLSAADPYYVLPVIMMVSMFLQTKLNPTPPDPIQAKVMMAMPFVFGVMFFFFPAGLVLYWIVNNILSIAQQWQITRMIESGGDKPKKKAANDPRA
ncbi:MAG: membrane protein insertase YidC [Zoogloeaceae bacterium]|jgi:YidC/Oxa1 family membrane protein insertase|nr:membrane protein insertase YidC [Zoogloeaceae bacterium]